MFEVLLGFESSYCESCEYYDQMLRLIPIVAGAAIGLMLFALFRRLQANKPASQNH